MKYLQAARTAATVAPKGANHAQDFSPGVVEHRELAGAVRPHTATCATTRFFRDVKHWLSSDVHHAVLILRFESSESCPNH